MRRGGQEEAQRRPRHTPLINAASSATQRTMKNDVKPAMRALNIATNLGIGAYALKEALGK